MWSKSRVVSVSLVAILIALVGCSISAFRADAAIFRVALRSRHQDRICVDLGTIVIEQTQYRPGATVALSEGTYNIRFLNPADCEWVDWETVGQVTVRGKTAIAYLDVAGEGTVTVVYRGICCRIVGGIVPTNTYMALAPYLAMIGLVATAAVAIKRKRLGN